MTAPDLLRALSDSIDRARADRSAPKRYDQCDATCTVDCGHCKGAGRPVTAVRPRTVAGMYGAGETTAPNVSQAIDGEDFTVSVDLTPAAAVMLEALAAALATDEALAAEWFILLHNANVEPCGRRELAVQELLSNAKVRRALTIEFTADAADELSGMLEDAAVEPDRCEGTLYAGTRSQPAEGCPRYALEGESFCSNHLPADDADTVREFEL